MVRLRVVVAVASVVLVGRAAAGDPPPPSCAGSEPYRFTVQGSTDDGATWNTYFPYMYVYGARGQSVYLKVRVLMTVTTGSTNGWSIGVRHDPSTLRYYGGDMTLEGVTTSGTNTATVQQGAPPDFNVTEARTGFDGWSQAIVIDNDQQVTLPPTSNFVTAGACYKIRVPNKGSSFAASVAITNDIGTPVVDSVVSQGGQSMLPCARNLTIYVYVYPSTPNTCSLGGSWLGSRTSGAEEAEGDLEPPAATDDAGCPESFQPAAPFSLGDANADDHVDISDAMTIFRFLFLGGVCLPRVATVLQTGQTQCYDWQDIPVDCQEIQGGDWWGQDAHYRNGAARRFEIEFDTVKDRVTGLMWERNPNRTPMVTPDPPDGRTAWDLAFEAIADRNLAHAAGYDDWRLPTIRELLTICDYSLTGNIWDNGGATARCGAGPCFDFGTDLNHFPANAWSSTAYRLHPDEEQHESFAWWLQLVDGNILPAARTADYGGVIGVRTWHDEVDQMGGEPVDDPVTDYQVGDANGDHEVNITDGIYVLAHLFQGGASPRLVTRSPVFPEAHADGRFAETAQTVLDRFTGLRWVRNPATFLGHGPGTWVLALSNSEDLILEDEGDWRLPDVSEQATLIDFSRATTEPDQYVHVFPDEFFVDPDETHPLFTSTTFVREGIRAWTVSYNNTILDRAAGMVTFLVILGLPWGEKTVTHLFLPVRGPY